MRLGIYMVLSLDSKICNRNGSIAATCSREAHPHALPEERQYGVYLLKYNGFIFTIYPHLPG